MQHVLVFRLSALGDVAMTVPVLVQVLEQNPQVHITLVTPAFHAPMFSGISRLSIFPFDKKHTHSNLFGLFKLFKQLKKLDPFYAIADIHDVLRTKILRSFFLLSGTRIAIIDKGRKEKKQLTQREDKKLEPLKSMFERYADVFRQLGLRISLQNQPPKKKELLSSDLQNLFSPDKKYICIAPFAKHPEKMYSLNKMESVVKSLLTDTNNQLFFLGGGEHEVQQLKRWEQKYSGTTNLAGQYSFGNELSLISNMHIVVSMDSANMHLASLYGVPVVSVWGATHPYAGFYGWGQQPDNAAQIYLSCRPCSIFGNKPCYRGDHACMERLEESVILKKINEIISL